MFFWMYFAQICKVSKVHKSVIPPNFKLIGLKLTKLFKINGEKHVATIV